MDVLKKQTKKQIQYKQVHALINMQLRSMAFIYVF